MPRLLTYLWTMPTTCIGLPLAAVALSTGGHVRVVRGVLEVHGTVIAKLLGCVPISGGAGGAGGAGGVGGASAMALGHIVIGRDAACLERTRRHERVHVRQAERWGPLFIPAYLFASAMAKLRGGNAYRDNPFEREAYNEPRA